MPAGRTVAFLGLGRMGAPMAARVAAAGHPLCTWNRTPRPAAVPPGAQPAATPAEAVADADVAVTMVADAAALDGILDGPDGVLAGAKPGLVLADMSTIGPVAARAAGTRAAEAGVSFLDAPVSGSIPAATDGTLLAMVGGSAAALEVARPVLAAMTAKQVHLGPVGSGAAMKVSLNMMLAVLNQSLAELLVLAERAGIRREAAYEVVAGGAMAAPYVHYKRAAFLDPDHEPIAFAIDLMRKDVDLALSLAGSVGLAAEVGRAAAAGLDRASAAGLGGKDVTAVLESFG